MEHIIKKIKNGAKHTRLTAVEKATMKSALLRHVNANPVRIENVSRHHSAKANAIISPFQINNLRNNKKTMPILVMLGLLMSGGASFAAENTVPGDVLYPVKVHVNENVRGTFAVTPKAKAEWEVALVERRLQEVEKLATTPSALPEAQQTAQKNLADYTKHVEDRIAKFEEDNDSEDALATAGSLAGTLSAHEAILTNLSQNSSATTVAGATATSTAATIATSTATTTVGLAQITDPAVVSQGDVASLLEILSKIREVRGHAEDKNKELKHKYHPEEDMQDREMGDDEENGIPADWTPMPMSIPSPGTTPTTSTTTVSGATASTTVASVATTGTTIADLMGTTTALAPLGIRHSGHDEEKSKHESKHSEKDGHDEEIRATPTTSATTTPAFSGVEETHSSIND